MPVGLCLFRYPLNRITQAIVHAMYLLASKVSLGFRCLFAWSCGNSCSRGIKDRTQLVQVRPKDQPEAAVNRGRVEVADQAPRRFEVTGTDQWRTSG